MRIVFVNLSIEPYPPIDAQAISTCIQQTTRELRSAGHDVTILSRIGIRPVDESGVLEIPAASIHCSRVLNRLRSVKSRLQGLDWPGQDEYLRDVGAAVMLMPVVPDLFVVANDFHAPEVLKSLCPDSRVLLWLHNEQMTNHRDPKAAFQAIDRVVAVSGYIREWVLGHFPVAGEHVAVVHNGVNPDQFWPRPDFSVPFDPVRILFVGRLDVGKGPDVLVSAITDLTSRGVRAGVTLVGGRQRFHGDQAGAETYADEVLARLGRLGGTFLGPVSRLLLPDVMRRQDIVCVPSRANEAFSLVALEAMASGCAVLASDRGGLPEACGGAALHVDPDDAGSVRRALASLLGDPGLLRSYKERALSHARLESWAATASGMLGAAALAS